MQPRVIPGNVTHPLQPKAAAKAFGLPSRILDFIERHHLFVQLIPFLLVLLVLVLGALNQDVADSLRLVGDLPDLR